MIRWCSTASSGSSASKPPGVLLERIGPFYKRFRYLRDDGTFDRVLDRVLERLHVWLNQRSLIDLDTWMIDSTAVCVHPKPGLPQLFDHPCYRQRNIIERSFAGSKRTGESAPVTTTSQEFCRNSNASLHAAMPKAVLFVQKPSAISEDAEL